MRILLVSDLHSTLPRLDWIVGAAPSFDLVVLAGDQLDISSTVSLDAQSVVVRRYLALLRAAGRVAIGSGNHALTGPDAHGEQAALWLAEASWIWVYHWPPLGSPTCWTGSRSHGDADLNVWIDKHRPDIVLTGNVHESPFKRQGSWADRIGTTWVFDAGRQIGPVPCRVEIDLAAGTASWRSPMGAESLALDAVAAPERSVFRAPGQARRQYSGSGSGSRADPGRALGAWRWPSWLSTSETIDKPGVSPY